MSATESTPLCEKHKWSRHIPIHIAPHSAHVCACTACGQLGIVKKISNRKSQSLRLEEGDKWYVEARAKFERLRKIGDVYTR